VSESVSKARGRISELTHLVPIRRGPVPDDEWGDPWAHEQRLEPLERTSFTVRLGTILRAFDERERAGFPSVIRLFRQIHFAKWAIVDGGTRLLLSVVFDGHWGDYMRALAREVPSMLHLIWSNTVGWERNFGGLPPATRSERLMTFIRTHQVEVSFFYAHHPHLTVRDIDSLACEQTRERAPRSEYELAREMGSLADRRAILLSEFGPPHVVAEAKRRFTAVLAPRYDADSFRHAYRETFGSDEPQPSEGSRG
jgi:hypothetical protein